MHLVGYFLSYATTNLNSLAITSTALGGFKESGFDINKKWLLKM